MQGDRESLTLNLIYSLIEVPILKRVHTGSIP
jgi:hypothetical protein